MRQLGPLEYQNLEEVTKWDSKSEVPGENGGGGIPNAMGVQRKNGGEGIPNTMGVRRKMAVGEGSGT